MTAVLAVGAVVVVALLARAGSRNEETPRPAEGASPANDEPVQSPDPSDADSDPDDDWESVEVVAVTSEGYALVPDAHAVRLVPPHEEGEAWKAGESGRNRRGEMALAMSWHQSATSPARASCMAPPTRVPWRFEALGRDGEYTAFVFETREGADAALKLFRVARGRARGPRRGRQPVTALGASSSRSRAASSWRPRRHSRCDDEEDR